MIYLFNFAAMEYKNLTEEELIDLCKKHDLGIAGKKSELVKRLKNWEKENKHVVPAVSNVGSPLLFENTDNVKATTYLQVKAANISHYLNYGLIYPLDLEESEIYRSENRKVDIMTHFPQHIVVGNVVVGDLQEEEVLIELYITDIKVIKIEGSELSYLNDPMPISRIKSILFKSSKAKNTYTSSFKTFPDFFLDDSLCSIFNGNLKIVKEDFAKINLPNNDRLTDWKVKLKKFDKVMGMFAYMKNVGVFFAEKENLYQEYTPNYISALSILNPGVKFSPTKDIALYRYILLPNETEVTSVQRFLFRQIIFNIYNDVEFTSEVAMNILNEALSFNTVFGDEKKEQLSILEYFNKVERNQIAFPDLLQVDIIKKNYPILTLLFLTRFSNKGRQHADKQAVRNNFIRHEGNLSRSIVEFLTGVLGLYYGYKNMIKEDTNLKFTDTTFQRVAEEQQSIKLRLATTFDRVTIESVFNYCKFETPIIEDYSYLTVKTRPSAFYPSKIGSYNYNEASFQIYDTKITVIERISKSARFIDFVNRTYGERISPKSALLGYLISNHGLDKKALTDLVNANVDKIDLDELSKLIEFDIKHRNAR
jgi:hypothetical protein